MRFHADYEWSLTLAGKPSCHFLVRGNNIALKLNPKVFFPHPDSLLLVNCMKIKRNDAVLDLGTGSGILAIAAALLGAKEVHGTDANPHAIKLAKKNSRLNEVEHKCIFHKADWFEGFSKNKFDVIVVNPPQIPGIGKTESKYFKIATEAGEDGTAPTILLLKESKKYLTENGRLYLVLKGWMDWKKVITYMRENYMTKKLGETFSPVWTQDKGRLKQIKNLEKTGKAKHYRFNGKKYYKIYAFECSLC